MEGELVRHTSKQACESSTSLRHALGHSEASLLRLRLGRALGHTFGHALGQTSCQAHSKTLPTPEQEQKGARVTRCEVIVKASMKGLVLIRKLEGERLWQVGCIRQLEAGLGRPVSPA